VAIAFSRICLSVHALKGKRLELFTPNLVHIYSIAVAQHALTQGSKGQGHPVIETVTVARLLVTMSRIPHTNISLPAWSACRYDHLCFLVLVCFALLRSVAFSNLLLYKRVGMIRFFSKEKSRRHTAEAQLNKHSCCVVVNQLVRVRANPNPNPNPS